MSSPGPPSLSSSSQGSNWVTWAVIGTTSCVAVAGLGYLAYTYWRGDDDEEAHPNPTASSTRQDEATAAKLRVARGLQMQAIMGPLSSQAAPRAAPKLPARTAPKNNKSAASSSAAGSKSGAGSAGSGSSRRVCGHCNKPTSGLPLRCSGCKQVYYCSQECQRKAWPSHKATCKASSGGGAKEAASPTAAQAASIDAPAGSDAAAKEQPQGEPQSFQDALAMYLEQAAESNEDKLEACFEKAVMLFVKGEYRAAIAQLQQVQAMAKERGKADMQGEVYKWLGHAHNRVAETARAEACFKEGIEHAKEHQLPKLEVDCLNGLGCIHRAQNQAKQAVETLEQALAKCGTSDSPEDVDARSSTLCNLGSALMAIDPSRGVTSLMQAVELRESVIERLHDAGERNGLATAVMEHAQALVNLASAFLVTRRLAEAEAAYTRALEVFELVEDVEKVVKVLVNLANMNEIQVATPAAYEAAAKYRKQLLSFLENHGMRRVDTQCAICLDPIAIKEVTKSDDKQLITLSCLHCLHNKCWEKWVETHPEGVTCPTCNQPVPLYDA